MLIYILQLLKVNAMLLQDLAQAEVTQLDGKDKILDRLRFMFTESSFEENNEEIETIQELLLNNDLAYDSDQFYDIKEALWTAHEKQGLKRGLSPEQDIRDHGLKTTGEKATQVGVTQFDEVGTRDRIVICLLDYILNLDFDVVME